MIGTKQIIESSEKIGTTLSALIPQLFFDLIARIIPGPIILFSLYLLFLDNRLLNSQDLWVSIKAFLPHNKFFMFCIAIVVLYSSSVLFYGIWAAIVRLLCFVRLPFMKAYVEVNDSSEQFSFRQDYIKLHAPIAGSRITKLKAEIHMSGSLTATYTLCSCVSGLSCLFSGCTKELIIKCIFFCIAAIGFFFSNRHYNSRLLRSVGSYSVLLGFDEQNRYSLPNDVPWRNLDDVPWRNR